MVDIWFTSDLHLGHNNVLSFQERPFSDIDEMNRSLLAAINKRAKTNDVLYILGDVAYKNEGGFSAAAQMIESLRCKKNRLVLGNHDATYANKWIASGLFETVSRMEEFPANGFGYGAELTLCHYPMLAWNRSRHNGKDGSLPSIMIHGHIHGRRKDNERNASEGVFRYDCGVDANDYAPVHVEEIIDFFARDDL